MNLKSITINNIVFSSKSKLIKHTRELLNSLGEIEIPTTNINYNFFFDLIQRHPDVDEKIGCGIKSFMTKYNLCNKKAIETYIIRTDNTIVNFSWVCCCNGEGKSTKELLNRALRQSIINQILEFKENNIMKCVYCGDENSEIHIDHINPFRDIVKKFLENKINIPTKFKKDDRYNQTMFQDEDKIFANDWEEYHRSHAQLQPLCTHCNLSKH